MTFQNYLHLSLIHIYAEYISATVQQALQDANMTIADVDAVAVTFAPGLIGAVLEMCIRDRPSSVRMGMVCKFGSVELMRPVRASVWIKVEWMRPSGPRAFSRPST